MSNRRIRQLKKEVAEKQFRFAGHRSFGVDANTAGAELDRIAKTYGGSIAAQNVVDEARPDEAPLHPVFEWDDSKAAEGYRRGQARNLIRAVVLVADPESSEAKDDPIVVNVIPTPEHRTWTLGAQDGDKPRYHPTASVVADPALMADAVQRLARILQQARRGVEELDAISQRLSPDAERMARISLAMQAIQAADAAVAAMH